MQRQHLTVHHDVHGALQVEFNPPGPAARRQRVIQVRAVVQRVQIADQSQAANRPPADILHKAVGRIRHRRDHHFTAGKFAVAEAQEQAGPAVKLRLAIGAERKRAAAQSRQTRQHTQQISQLPQTFEFSVGDGGNIGGKADAQQVDVVKNSVFVGKPQHVAGAPSPSEDSRGRVLHTAVGEVAQERVAGAERKKTEGAALAVGGAGKQAVYDLVSGADAPYGEELAIATGLRLA